LEFGNQYIGKLNCEGRIRFKIVHSPGINPSLSASLESTVSRKRREHGFKT
jgi:hypothetical protein